ncbi:MAG: hypothetical protein V7754_10995 [Halioglobus sp.]
MDTNRPYGSGSSVQELFRQRMEAQCGQIERYRLAVKRHEGRCLSSDEAAREWIERFAEAFAQS